MAFIFGADHGAYGVRTLAPGLRVISTGFNFGHVASVSSEPYLALHRLCYSLWGARDLVSDCRHRGCIRSLYGRARVSLAVTLRGGRSGRFLAFNCNVQMTNGKYQFIVNRSLRQYDAWRTMRVLASPPMVVLFLVLLIVAVLSWAVVLLGLTTPLFSLGLALLASGATGLTLLPLAFATTFLYYQSPPKSVPEILIAQDQADCNVATAATMPLLKAVGPYARASGDSSTLTSAFRSLLHTKAARHMITRLELNAKELASAVEEHVVLVWSWPAFAQAALNAAIGEKTTYLGIGHAIAAFLTHPALATFLRQHELTEKDIQFVGWWIDATLVQEQERDRWWDPDRLLDFMGIGLAWTSGFTPMLDRFSRIPRGNLWDQFLIGRQTEVDELVATLARQRQSNILLVGQPGVGRLGIVQALADRMRTGKAHPELNGQRLAYVHIGQLLGQADTSATQLSIISRVLREMEQAGNIIAVLDGLSGVLGVTGEQRVNLTDVLLPFFSSLAVRVVVIVSADDYHLRLKTNQELVHFFEVVQVPSATSGATLQALALAALTLEPRTGVYLPYRALKTIVDSTDDILPHIPFPERAFDILEEALVMAEQARQPTLTEELIGELIARKVGVPIGKVKGEERSRLLNLEAFMHRRIVNQEFAVASVARAMIRARAGVRNPKRPIGTFLFLGPTGVGKTETAKTLAEAFFGAEEHMVRLDMSEFQSEVGAAALIGSPHSPVGRLTAAIADQPFTVLLLDEFEKAHRAVHQLFLQVLDEGRLTNVQGQPVSFKHTIIIATSNAGAEFIREAIGQGPLPQDFERRLTEYILENNIFTPELLNRFDGVISFTPLSAAHVRQIAGLMLNSFNRRLDDMHGVTVAVTDGLLDFLVEVGYNPQFGARPMARAIQNTVEFVVAQQIIAGHVAPGHQLTLTPEILRAAMQRGTPEPHPS